MRAQVAAMMSASELFALAKRSNMRKARVALARRLAIIMHAMLRHGTEFQPT